MFGGRKLRGEETRGHQEADEEGVNGGTERGIGWSLLDQNN